MRYKHTVAKRKLFKKRFIAVFLGLVLIASVLVSVLRPGVVHAQIAFVSNSSASGTSVSSLSINTPSGIAVGNALVAEVSFNNNHTITVTPPSGWAQIGSLIRNGNGNEAVYYHVVASGDPTSVSWSFSRSSNVLIGMGAFSGEDTKNVVDVFASQSNSNSSTQTAPSVTASYSGDMVVPLLTYASGQTASTFSSGLTKIWQTNTTNVGYFGAYELFNNAGATGTFQTTTASGTSSIAFTVALKPAAAAIGIQYKASDTPATCTGCTSLSPAAPSGWVAGDFFLTSVTWNTNTASLTAPSGWTQIDTTFTNGTYALADFYHFAASGDPSSYTWNFSASTQAIISTSDYSGVDTSNPVDASANTVNTSNSTSHTLATLTTNFSEDMLVGIWGYEANTTTTTFPTTMTRDWNSSNGGSDGSTAAHVLLGAAGTIGTYTAKSGTSTIALMHTIALRAYLPTPELIEPTNTNTDILLKPVFQLVNASVDNSPLEYKIQLCSTSTCSSVLQTFDETASQTGWSGQDQNSGTAYTGSSVVSSSTIATYTAQTALSAGTQYWWRGYSYDTGTASWSLPSNVFSFTTSYVPAAPTLLSPASNATNIPSQTEFQVATTDTDGDPVEYKIQICSDNACSTVLQTFDETASQTGFSGQDSSNYTAYATDPSVVANSTPAYYDLSTQLTPGTTYYWRAYAINPTGSNLWSAASSINGFTVNSSETRILNGTIEQGTIL